MERRLGRRGAALVLCLAAAACRREPAAPGAPAKAAGASDASGFEDVAARAKRPPGAPSGVIWVGLDGLDFELVDRLAAEGRMPNWKRLAAEGYTAKLTSYMPILSPIVWTTLATGVGPDVHRVLDFQEIDPATGQKVPISGHSRALPAIWNVASASGRTVGVVGWWATHPAEEVKGFFVSDRASPILFDGLPKEGVAFPATLAAGVEQISEREGKVSDDELAAFVRMPVAQIAAERAGSVGLSNRVAALARTIGATRTEARIARELYDRNLPDLMMLYIEGTDVVGHLFATEAPPQLRCVSAQDFARYGGTAAAYYALVDRLLGQWMRRAEEDGATLLVTSDHGFKWGSDRSCERGSLNPETAGFWHRLDGVFAAWGSRVVKGSSRGQASVFDVDPTIAALLGLPVDTRATGTPIRAAFRDLSTPPREDLAVKVPVRRLAASAMSEKESSEYAKKLLALGYLSGKEAAALAPTGGDRPGLTEMAWNNLGLYLSSRSGKPDLAEAEKAYRRALELAPDYGNARLNLAAVHRLRGQDREAIDELFAALQGRPDPDQMILDWSLSYELRKDERHAAEVLERGVAAYPGNEPLQRALALLRYRQKDCRRADALLSTFEATTRAPETLNALALVRACLGRREDAIRLFRRSLAIEPDQAKVIQSLSVLGEAPATGGPS
ncbi:MAG TPA: alkaline phosphatase family protein [Thermoanaerobaculia bacterium]|nr:alkaline phosphatase family protein [Thermoanaerobaculia bacterium]